MKNFFVFIMVIVIIIIGSCPTEQKSDDTTTAPAGPLDGIQKREIIAITGGTFTQQSDTDFDGDVLDAGESFVHTVSSFRIAKYETTYELWYTVFQWAIIHGYSFEHCGAEGYVIPMPISSIAPSTRKYEPVTYVNWRDAIVWCNAYSRMTGLTPCYSYSGLEIKNSIDETACDNAICNWSADGYRLPSEGEWQYAASDMGTTPYDYASGATADYHDSAATALVSWFNTNVTHNVGGKNGNAHGLFDMSGNVAEWCWDHHDTYPGTAQTDYRLSGTGEKIARGGSFLNTELAMQIGYRNFYSPDSSQEFLSFRVARKN